ncbi:unnamed protein product [Ixodes persulcatus]
MSSVQLAVERLEGLFCARAAEVETVIMQAKSALDKNAKNCGGTVVAMIQDSGKFDRTSWTSAIEDIEREASSLPQETARTEEMLASLSSTMASIKDGLQKL